MKSHFNNQQFKFVRYFINFENELEEILVSEKLEGNIGSEQDELFLSFKKNKRKISVNFIKKAKESGKAPIKGEFEIDLKPIVFQNVNKECLFKIYDCSDFIKKDKIFRLINKKYEFYLPDNQIP